MMLTCVLSAQSVVARVDSQDTCISKFTALIASAPKNDDNYAERARCHYFKSTDLRTSSGAHTTGSDAEIALALADAQKALDLNPKNTNALNVRGIVKSYKGDEIAARVDFDRVIEIDPRGFKAYMNRGIGKNRLMDFAGAIADYTKVIEIATPMSAVYSERGISYSNLGKKAEAIADLNKALQLDPKNKQASDALAKLNRTATTTAGSLQCVSGNCINGKGKVIYQIGDVYEGDFVNSQRQGQGTYTFKNGEVYTGQFTNNAFTGKGKLVYPGGEIYEGDFLDNERNGQGTLRYKTGYIYTGQWVKGDRTGYGKLTDPATNGVWEGTWKDNTLVTPVTAPTTTAKTSGSIYKTPTITRGGVDQANANMTPEMKRQLEDAGNHENSGNCVSGNCVNGYGKATFPNGDVYEGSFVNGKSEGQGTLTFKSGVVYTGQFANGFRNGIGKTVYAGGSVHEGYWVDDQKSGQGTLTFAKGDVYTGQFANGKYNGKGTYKYSNGQVYEGDWVNDKREGQGTLKFANGRIYTGQFAANTYNGKGKFTFENKDTYDGEWVAGKRTGKGTYTKPDGSNYVGEWKDDKYNGYGKQFTKVDGKVLEGTWKDGVLVDPSASNSSSSNNVPTRRTPTAAEINAQASQVTPEMRKKKEELQRSTKALGDAADKLYPDDSITRTDAEWEKIAADYKVKIEDAVEKKKDDELAIKIYGEFDQAVSIGRERPQVKFIRRQILRVMFQKGGSLLTSFVLKEMKKLNYTEEDKYVVLNSAIYV